MKFYSLRYFLRYSLRYFGWHRKCGKIIVSYTINELILERPELKQGR